MKDSKSDKIVLDKIINFPANMSSSLALGSKGVHAIFSTWDPKISNNKSIDCCYPIFDPYF
jgi:hypothetical protein